MAQAFPETAHLKTDLKKYGEEYDRIFGKRQGSDWCPYCGRRISMCICGTENQEHEQEIKKDE